VGHIVVGTARFNARMNEELVKGEISSPCREPGRTFAGLTEVTCILDLYRLESWVWLSMVINVWVVIS
jgi:hypothetical protein